ncbi:metallophosphoesterase [Anaerovorax sp. IOR16]|uniref:metallophosphoesterase n=1 Tax=Anaerovorax sp. IOR16 TaxID=2773458 RepID=UPI0019D1A4DB|nr:metallophosphoesterase [Anaerovorax sp. IOR16]
MAYAKRFYDNVFASMMQGDEYLKQVRIQKDELTKVKRQFFDQRREYNKLLTSDARADYLTKHLINCAKELNDFIPLKFNKSNTEYEDKEAVLVFSDWHYGMVTNNIWNEYDTAICRKRVEELVVKTKKYIDFHKPKNLHIILLGDAAHGSIHTGCRVASEEDTCDQIMNVAEIIAESVNELADDVNKTFVYSTYGNHLRTIQNKKDSIHSDNMEKLISWWLKPRLNHRNDVEIIDSEFKEFIKLNVCGYNVVCCHGDLDKIKDLGITVNTIFTKLYGETIDYTISGDKHHLEEFESFDIENILVRSLCGTDEYANNHRLYSNAGQTLMFFTKNEGRECTYNIKLN